MITAILSLTDQLRDILNSLGGFGPELWLAGIFCVVLLVELLGQGCSAQRTRTRLSLICIGAVVLAAIWAVWLPVRGPLFLHLLFLDNQAVVVQVLVASCAGLVFLYERLAYTPGHTLSTTQRALLPTEWYALVLAMTLGLFLMTISINLLSIYLSIELVSICSYLLTALLADRKAAEGGIKYLLFGAVSSAIMLYGMSLLYGMSGTLDLTVDAFGASLAQQQAPIAAVALLLTLSGLLFKLAGVPFHVWAPDTYEAAPVPVAAFFSVAPKAAAILVLMRVVSALPLESLLGGTTVAVLQTPLAVIALAGILIGNLSALRQTDAKRLLAYSSIAHAGFLLVGVVALNRAGFEAVLFYISTYLFISLAAFFLVDLLARTEGVDLTISHFAGLGAKQPLLAVALTIVMIALTGLPPTVGFTAKLLSFSALYDAYQQSGNGWLLALFALGLLNALISLAYYLKIPFLLFFRPYAPSQEQPAPVPVSRGAIWLAVGLTIPIIGLFLKPELLSRWLTGW